MGIEFDHALRAIKKFLPQFPRLQNFDLIAKAEQALTGIVFELKTEKNSPLPSFIR
jgi:hypothetical protein